jgi:hypothetical protein
MAVTVRRAPSRFRLVMTVPGLFAAVASRFDATLFMGAAIAITAFPMLARSSTSAA